MTWILLVLVCWSGGSEGRSAALTNVPGFTDEAECKAAGKVATEGLVGPWAVKVQAVCVKQTKK